MSNNIIEVTPILEKYEVEHNGKKFDCRNCMGLGDCCGTVMVHNNKAACYKCKCQSLFNSSNRTKEGAEKTNQFINSTNCKNCDESNFTEDFCKSMMYLENNLEKDFVDCSNTLLVTGANNTLNDIEQKTNCNIDNQESVTVDVYNPPPPQTNFLSTDFLSTIKAGGINISLVLILILLVLVILKRKK